MGARSSPLALTAGTALLLLLVYLLGAIPSSLPLIYLLFAAVALPHRFYSFLKRRWGFFLLDYCYFANFGAVAYLLLCPQGGCRIEVTASVWALVEGPLAAAIIPWRCAWLPTSHDHITSTLIHTLPGLAIFAQRHAGPPPAWLQRSFQLPWNPVSPDWSVTGPVAQRMTHVEFATASERRLSSFLGWGPHAGMSRKLVVLGDLASEQQRGQQPQQQDPQHLPERQREGRRQLLQESGAAGTAASPAASSLGSGRSRTVTDTVSSSGRTSTGARRRLSTSSELQSPSSKEPASASFDVNVWLQSWQQAWQQHAEFEVEDEQSEGEQSEGGQSLLQPWLWLLALPAACHCAWQLLYLIVVQGCCRRLIKAHGYETSYSSLARRAARTNNIWNRVVRRGSATRRVLVYGALHGAFTAVALLWATATWFCFPLAVAWQVVKILLPLYYGAVLMCGPADKHAAGAAQHDGWPTSNGQHHALHEHSNL